MGQVTVTSTKTIGKAGAKRTVHYLSNGWFVNESNNNKRGNRFALYKPGAGSQGVSQATFIRGDDQLKRLLDYVNGLKE